MAARDTEKEFALKLEAAYLVISERIKQERQENNNNAMSQDLEHRLEEVQELFYRECNCQSEDEIKIAETWFKTFSDAVREA